VCPWCSCPPTSEDGESGFKWEFHFLVEDTQGHTLPIIVADEEAEQLLSLKADKYPTPTPSYAQNAQKPNSNPISPSTRLP